MTFWSRDFARSRDKLKPFSLHIMTSVEGLLPIDHMTIWSCSLPKSQKLKPLYLHYQIVLAVWWLTLRGSYSCSHKALSIITWIYYITQQTKNRSLLPQYLWSPNLAWWWNGVRRLKLHEPSIMMLRGHVKKFYISTCTRPMATKQGKVVTYPWDQCKFTWQFEKFIPL